MKRLTGDDTGGCVGFDTLEEREQFVEHKRNEGYDYFFFYRDSNAPIACQFGMTAEAEFYTLTRKRGHTPDQFTEQDQKRLDYVTKAVYKASERPMPPKKFNHGFMVRHPGYDLMH